MNDFETEVLTLLRKISAQLECLTEPQKPVVSTKAIITEIKTDKNEKAAMKKAQSRILAIEQLSKTLPGINRFFKLH